MEPSEIAKPNISILRLPKAHFESVKVKLTRGLAQCQLDLWATTGPHGMRNKFDLLHIVYQKILKLQ